jgi:hypothetical protein
VTKINVYLDDIRDPLPGFVLARTYYECIDLLQKHDVYILSLDHDLGGKRTGYDVCKYIVENNRWPDEIYLHTANPVGRDNMYQLLNRYKSDHVKLYRGPMVID